MKYDDSDKLYQQVGSSRLLDITVYLDDIEVYTGMDTSVKIINNLRERIKKEKLKDEEDVKQHYAPR